MSITKAESAGFCYGVNRAIDIVNGLLADGEKVCTLGPIIHNMAGRQHRRCEPE